MDNIQLKIVTGLEKCFIEQKIETKKELSSISALSDERIYFQLLYSAETELFKRNVLKCKLNIISPLKDKIKIEKVEQVPVRLAAYYDQHDDDYLKIEPGLYPDLLLPFLPERDSLTFVQNELRSLFITVEDKNGIKAGKYPVVFEAVYEENVIAKACIELKVIEEKLAEQELIHTEWFHTDCLAQQYDCDVWSEKHWKIIDNYMKTAVRYGVNLLLTPVFTPPLDTLEGGERLTTQLVDVFYDEKEYTFGFDKLDRWIELAQSNGIKYFEINHFFTQWGAAHAPKVMACVNGEYKKIFGWETEASGEEYSAFLNSFLKALIPYLKSKGIDKKCFYHISDEPRPNHLENYGKARSIVTDLLKDYVIIDALSDYEFYRTGIVEHPIPGTNHIEPFVENAVPDLWTYYCCSQNREVSNRFLSMPGYRTRIIGAQLYKYNIKGFLQWGFNFWNSRYSIRTISPFEETSGDYFTPAGDCFMVYPAEDGTAYSSLHAEQFYMGLQDLRALKKCEQKIGREKTLELLEEGISPLTFKDFPRNSEYILSMREKINTAIENN